MNYDARVQSLRFKKADLEKALTEENKRPYPNAAAITEIKRQKLRIKDEIADHLSHSS